MSAYMLFFPKATQPDGLLAGAGLAELQTPGVDPDLLWVPSQSGPSGEPGLLACWFDHEVAGHGAYRPDDQQWKRAPSERFWIGTYTLHPLRPENIERTNRPKLTLPVLLNDGQVWQVPVANYLPHVWGTDKAGNFARTPEQRFEWFCREAERVNEQFLRQAAGGTMRLECQWEYICTALALGYRLVPEVIAALELIGDVSGSALLAATVERQLIDAVVAQKKTG